MVKIIICLIKIETSVCRLSIADELLSKHDNHFRFAVWKKWSGKFIFMCARPVWPSNRCPFWFNGMRHSIRLVGVWARLCSVNATTDNWKHTRIISFIQFDLRSKLINIIFVCNAEKKLYAPGLCTSCNCVYRSIFNWVLGAPKLL